jgi:hypothetical protein
VGGPGLVRPGRVGQAEGEREERGCERAARVSGWAERSEKKSREQPVWLVFVFLFQKNVNSNKFCLFGYELFRIPKLVKIIV